MCIFGNSEDTLKVISQSLDFFRNFICPVKNISGHLQSIAWAYVQFVHIR